MIDFKPASIKNCKNRYSFFLYVEFKYCKGYRIYYKDLDDIIILFLAGGDKSNQKEDIKQAEKYCKDYLEMLNNNG